MTPDFQKLWLTAKLNDHRDEVIRAAHLVNVGRIRYEAVAAKIKNAVPWQIIGCLHYREGDCSFATHLHNGDSLKHPTHNEPAHRPSRDWPAKVAPELMWETSAIDALEYDGMDHADWTHPASGLAKIEVYNGLGYRHRAINSPYLWSGTQHYTTGKFVADGEFSSSARDAQAGVAAILLALGANGLWKQV